MLIAGRLLKRAEFLAVSRSERKWVSQSFLLLFSVSHSEHGSLRVGYTTSRKLGNAVVRNRIRRRLKEAFALTLRDDQPTLTHAFDVVIIGRKSCYTNDFANIRAEMRKALRFVLAQSPQ